MFALWERYGRFSLCGNVFELSGETQGKSACYSWIQTSEETWGWKSTQEESVSKIPRLAQTSMGCGAGVSVITDIVRSFGTSFFGRPTFPCTSWSSKSSPGAPRLRPRRAERLACHREYRSCPSSFECVRQLRSQFS
jgi:hypothetical protein